MKIFETYMIIYFIQIIVIGMNLFLQDGNNFKPTSILNYEYYEEGKFLMYSNILAVCMAPGRYSRNLFHTCQLFFCSQIMLILKESHFFSEIKITRVSRWRR